MPRIACRKFGLALLQPIAFGWICLAVAIPAGWAQRGGQQASEVEEVTVDETAEASAPVRERNSEPPKLKRGTFVQQLKSVTETVLGTSDLRSLGGAKSTGAPQPPEPNYVTYSGERYGDAPRGGAPVNDDASTNQNRSWAGQFLIPSPRNSANNNRSRSASNTTNERVATGSRVGSKMTTGNLAQTAASSAVRPTADTRKVNVPPRKTNEESRFEEGEVPSAELAPRNLAGVPNLPKPPTGIPNVPPTSKAAGTGTNAMPNTDYRTSEPRSAAITSRTKSTDGVAFKLTDDSKEDSREEAESEEIRVTAVPEIPHVPRKAVPKRKVDVEKPTSTRAGIASADAKKPNTPNLTTRNSTTAESTNSPESLSAGNRTSTGSESSSVSMRARPSTSSVNTMDAPSVPRVSTLSQSGNGATLPSDTKAGTQPVPLGSPAELRPIATPSTTAGMSASSLPVANALPPASATPAPSSLSLPRTPSAELAKNGSGQLNSDTSAGASTNSLLVPPLPSLPIAGNSASPVPSNTAPSQSLPTAPNGAATAKSSLPVPSLPSLPAAGSLSTTMPLASAPERSTKPEVTANRSNTSSEVNASKFADQAKVGSSIPSGPSSPAKNLTTSEGLSELMSMDIPHVNVKLLGPANLQAGVATPYSLLVSNVDRIGLDGLILRMETPAGVLLGTRGGANQSVQLEKAPDGAVMLTWEVAAVSPGGNISLPLEIKTDEPKNFAVAMEWTVLPTAGVKEVVVQHAELQLAFEGPSEVEKDVANVYKLKVFNPGNAVAKNVKVQVGADAQDTSNVEIGDLQPGQAEVIEMDLTFEKAGSVSIKAIGAAQGNLNRESQINVTVRQAILTAGLTVPSNAAVGDLLTALVEIRNSGDATARNVQAGLALPLGTEIMDVPEGVTKQGEKVMWKVDSIAAGSVASMPLSIRLTVPGEQSLKFACVTPNGTVSTCDSSIVGEAFSDLKLMVNDPPSPAQVGSTVTYELAITNRGSKEASQVQVVAQFSDGIEPENATGGKHRLIPGQVLFEPIPAIAPGQTIKLLVTAKASSSGIHRFRAEVKSDENECKLVEEEATRFLDSNTRIASPTTSSPVLR